MESMHVDLLVVGWGKGGKTLAAAFGKAGKRVAMVEQSDQMYGGTCINIGCVPTKTLLHDADQRRAGDDRAGFYTAAIERKTTLIDALRAKNFSMLDSLDSVTTVTGRARFSGPRTVEVTAGADRLAITGDAVVINTGAVPVLPPIPGIDGPRVATSTDLIADSELPRTLVVIGGGAIGLELANMYNEFGSVVTVIETAPTLLGGQEPEIAAEARTVLDAAGITVLTGASVTHIDDDGTGAASVHYRSDDTTGQVSADTVLVVTGRKPATDGLGLAEAGIDLTDKGAVKIDEHLRTTAENVYAVGDVNGGPQFTYISLDDHRVVFDQLTGAGTRSTADRVAVPSTIFLTPPLARVGMTEQEAVDAGHQVLVAVKKVAEVAAMPRPKAVADPRGLIKIVVDADSDLILGASWFSVDSQEVINLIALAIRAGVTAGELRDGIWTHPSTTEGLNEVLGALEPTTLTPRQGSDRD